MINLGRRLFILKKIISNMEILFSQEIDMEYYGNPIINLTRKPDFDKETLIVLVSCAESSSWRDLPMGSTYIIDKSAFINYDEDREYWTCAVGTNGDFYLKGFESSEWQASSDYSYKYYITIISVPLKGEIFE